MRPSQKEFSLGVRRDYRSGLDLNRVLFNAVEPHAPRFECAVALELVAFLFVAHLFTQFGFERWQQVEGDVGGLESLGLSMSDVVGQAAVGASAGSGYWALALSHCCGIAPGQHA